LNYGTITAVAQRVSSFRRVKLLCALLDNLTTSVVSALRAYSVVKYSCSAV
jgi:hypothetical protein